MQLRSGLKCALTTALGMTLFLTTSGAKANGRFPRGEHILEWPSDPNRILLAATYGLVTTSDGGKNWYYVCESAFSLYPPPMGSDPGYTGDPLLAITADGSLLAGVQTRVTKSTDGACGWAKSFEDPAMAVDDIAVAPSNRNIAVALVRKPAVPKSVQVYGTTDGGATWGPLGTPLTMLETAYTIDLDPKDPTHLMVTGATATSAMVTAVFMSSTNNGMTWTSSPIPNTSFEAPPYIAGVHPTDGKIVFVRTDEWVDDPTAGASLARDALMYTKDGGQTWTELLRVTGDDGNGAKLYGFAFSPDGSTVLAGYGDPNVGGGRNINRDVAGVYKSTGADYSFGATPKPIYSELTTCVTWTAKGIYICGSPDGPLTFIAFASDVSKVSNTGVTRLMVTSDIKGQPTCCSGRAVTSCDWNVDCQRLGACSDGGASADAGVCTMPDAGRDGGGGAGGGSGDASTDRGGGGAAGAGTGGAAGAGTGGAAGGSGSMDGGARGGSGGAGTGGSSTGGSGTAGTTSGSGGSGGSDDGCSCRMSSSSGASPTALSALFGLVAASTAMRRRKSNRAS